MNIIDKIAREMEIKADLMGEGINIEEDALEGVGSKYLENITGVFDYMHHGLKPGTLWPSEMIFPGGTVYKVIFDTRSPYSVKREDGTLVLEKGGKFVSTVRWVDRPEYHNKKTTYGTEMRRILPLMGECFLLACISTHCANWEDGNQCRYCNFNLAQKNLDTSAVLKEGLYTQQRADEVGEVVKAVMDEGIRPCLIISSGHLPQGKEVNPYFLRIVKAVKQATGLQEMMGCVQITPPQDFSGIDQLYEVGVRDIVLNLEVWNPDMFKAICPGKHKRVGQERWKKALEYAVSVFGRANVSSGFVFGLEEKDNYYEAADWLSERGIFPVFQPWYPQKGSKLENHRPPRPEWTMEVHEGAMDIVCKNLPEVLSLEFNNSDKLGCYRCQGTVLCWDSLRRRIGGFQKVMPREEFK